jgi:Tfp pilus assembly protein PilN
MMRVNLLPPEILERRRAESRIGWVALAAVGVALILAVVWGFSSYRVQAKRDELAAIQQQVQVANAEAAQLAIFEQRATELQARTATVAAALGGRYDFPRLWEEISLVLPTDAWIQSLNSGEASGITFSGYVVGAPDDTPDAGHKALAKTLVRLTDLDDLYDVWTSSSNKVQVEQHDALQFSITAKIKAPGSEGGAQ